MSSHDPLCTVFHVEECDCPDDACLTYCQCDLIAKVRADERETAAERVSKVRIFALHSKTTPDIWTQLVPLDAAVAAARGESP